MSRGKRKRTRPRSKTIAALRLSWRERLMAKRVTGRPREPRPATRGDCGTIRPCPYVSCRHHLYLDVNPKTGALKLNFPDLDVWEIPETCALDCAERMDATLEEVGERMNITRERVRQVEARVMVTLRGPMIEQW